MPSLLAAVAFLPVARLAIGQPTISFPFNAQLPLAARIDEFFSYSFSPSTFQSDSEISYSLGDHPSWLSIDSGGRRLFGTPKDGDVLPGEVVGQAVDIIATDSTGSTPMNATVVVSRKPAPQVRIPLEKQIQSFGAFSAPSSILSYPSTSFTFSFDQGTFEKSGLNYYAVSADSSPLPAWIQFDASTLTFSGKTPPIESLIQPPHTFDFNLVASDIVGFSAASLKFSIVVGSHKLTTDSPIVLLNASRGSEVTYNGFENGIKLDGKQVAPGDLTVVVKDMPSWLAFDPKSWKLQGTPNDGDRAANFTVTFRDGFSDNLDVLMVVDVASGLFASTVQDIQVKPGSELELDLTKYFREPSDVTVTVSTSPNQDWLQVSGLRLSGQVPNTSKGSFKLFVQASSKSSNLADKQTVNVSFLAPDGTTTTETPAVSTSTTTTTSTAAATEIGDDAPEVAQTQSGHLTIGQLLLATIIPMIFVALLLLLLVCYLRRRRNRNNYLSSSYRSKMFSNRILSTLRTKTSVASMQEAAAATGGRAVVHAEALVSKLDKVSFADNHSPTWSRRRSSETLDDVSFPGVAGSIRVDTARTTTVRRNSNVNSEDGRQSWVTIEGGTESLARSERSFGPSRQSVTTCPESTSQVLPGADYSSHKRDARRDTSFPTAEELARLKPSPLFAYKRSPLSYHGVGGQTGVTYSSAGLPPLKDDGNGTAGALTRWTTESTARDPSDPNWVSLAEGEVGGSVREAGRPGAAALGGSGNLGSASKSVTTDISFASSENWRILGPHSPSKGERTYRELVEESPFHPSRPGTADAGPDLPSQTRRKEIAHPPVASGRVGPSESILSKMSGVSEQDVHMSGGRGDGADADDAWVREHSAKMSAGSYKVFL